MQSTYNKITVDSDTTAVIIYPAGRLDVTLMDELSELFERTARENPGCHVLVDMSEVEYMSSSCLRILVSATKNFEKMGLKLKLFGLNSICKKIIDIVRLDKLIDIYDMEEQAVRSL